MPRRNAAEQREEFKRESVKIPISGYFKMQQWVNEDIPQLMTALVASSDFSTSTEKRLERDLIYVEGDSRNSRLQLWDFVHLNEKRLPQRLGIKGTYDRDEETENTTAIYLKQGDVYTAAYPGTLEELLEAHMKAL